MWHYRNNPSEKHSYEVFAGEPKAMHYVRTGRQEIKHGDYLAVLIDEVEPIITSYAFVDKLLSSQIHELEHLCKGRVKSEGTLVLKQF